MSSHPDLRLDWCSYQAAKYAIEHWHYSRTMPIGKLVRLGVWEDRGFIGTVIYSTGASPQLHRAFGLSRFELCELVRIGLRDHSAPVSRIVAVSLRLLRRQAPALRLVVSFADPEQGHLGGIYQAGGWLYLGQSTPGLYYDIGGRLTHNRNLQGPKGFQGKSLPQSQESYTAALRGGLADGSIKAVRTAPKHKYAMPFDDEIRERIAPMAQPYPKRVGSADGGMPGDQPGGGGSIPTPALQKAEVAA